MNNDDGIVRRETKFYINGKPVTGSARVRIDMDPVFTESTICYSDELIASLPQKRECSITVTNVSESFMQIFMGIGVKHETPLFQRKLEMDIVQSMPASPPIPRHNVRYIPWREMPRHLWAIMRRAFAEARGTATNETSVTFKFHNMVMEPNESVFNFGYRSDPQHTIRFRAPL